MSESIGITKWKQQFEKIENQLVSDETGKKDIGYNKYIEKARQEGVAPEAVEQRAEKLFIRDEYRKSVKEFKEFFKDQDDLVIKNFTIKQAVNFINGLNKVAQAQLEKDIAQIRMGLKNGFEVFLRLMLL